VAPFRALVACHHATGNVRRQYFHNLAAWERIAVVTDVDWIRMATKAFGFAMPGEVRVFSNAELGAARDWLSG
jgi:hypothetical protein